MRDWNCNDVLYGVQALQMILAAIEKSDGTRRGVRDQVFAGAGITIAADRAIIGKTISIDPATGDTNINDVTVLRREGPRGDAREGCLHVSNVNGDHDPLET